MNSPRVRRLKGAFKTGGPRQRIRRLRFSQFSVIQIFVLFAVIICTTGWWISEKGYMRHLIDEIGIESLNLTAELGFRVKEVMVRGRSKTTREELIRALKVSRGIPIFSINLKLALKRVEQLPWVDNATIERMLPDTVLINIEERTPLAIWQHKGRLALIDKNGEIILRNGLGLYSSLPLVVGDDAAAHASELIQLLKVEPDLMDFVKAATWVGGRRWNVHLNQDIDVRLPEMDPGSAWRRLAEYDRNHGIIDRKIKVLDLRIPGRLIIRMLPDEINPNKNISNERET